MALWNRKRKQQEELVEAKSNLPLPANLSPVIPPSAFGETYAGTSIGYEWTAIQSLAAFYRGINIICDHVAQTPFIGYSTNRGALDPQPSLLVNPTPGESPYDFWYQVAWSMLLRGNAYLWILDRSYLGYPTALFLLNPNLMSVLLMETGEVQYRLAGELIDPTDIVHIRGPRPAGSIVGVGILQAQKQVLGHGVALQEFSARYFGDGAVPSGVIETGGPLSEPDQTRLRNEWRVAHGNRHRYPAVLPDGMKYSPLAVTPEDQQLLESRQWSNTEMALALGIPPRWLGGTGDAFVYANLEAENAQLVQFGLRPWTSRIEAAFTQLLPKPQYVRADFDDFLRANTLERYQAYATALTAGFLTVDEVRDREGLPELPNTPGGGAAEVGYETPEADMEQPDGDRPVNDTTDGR